MTKWTRFTTKWYSLREAEIISNKSAPLRQVALTTGDALNIEGLGEPEGPGVLLRVWGNLRVRGY